MERNRNNIIFEYGMYMLAFFASYIASLAGFHIVAGIILISVAIYLYIHWVREFGCLVEMRALFTLAWVGGQGIACLQLSKLQTDWHYMTWLSFFLIYIGFGFGYEWGLKYRRDEEKDIEKNEDVARRLFICIISLAVVSLLCFFFEVWKVGFIPVFSDMPHAYSFFHVSGVHYFTISCILIPAISILYLKSSGKQNLWRMLILGIANVLAVVIPFLCVSRFQLLFAVGFAVVTYIMVNRTIRFRTMAILLATLVPMYVILTVFRNHDVAYLNSIFEMKWDKMPIFITQPYMYVANNFENYNCMVVQLTEHTWGIRMLFPLFALTGLKFLFPQLTASPAFLTKPELTTLTMFYDAYYDFGIVGVFVFAILIGCLARMMINRVRKRTNPITYLFYGQVAIYLGLAFFTTWFSNPTTWFWLVLTSFMYWFVGYDKNKKGKE